MSLNLPGYYYDPTRNRYFPITSLPPGAPIPSASTAAPSTSNSATATAGSASGPTRKKRKTVADVSQPKDSRSNAPRNNSNLWGIMHSARSNPRISFAERSHVAQYVFANFDFLYDWMYLIVCSQMEAHAISRTRLQSQEELPLGPGCRLTALAVRFTYGC